MTETTVAEPLVVERTETKPGYAGQSVPRKEDRRLVQGEGLFFDDVKRHNMGYVHFVRSPYAHAKITKVDLSQALAAPVEKGQDEEGQPEDDPVHPDRAAEGGPRSPT